MSEEYRSDKAKLAGRLITGCKWTKDGTKLSLETPEGLIEFETGADCCSQSWIEHVTTPKFPARVLSYEEKNLPDPKPSGRQECDRAYSVIFKTDQGDLEVEFRNSSNGYYGGSLDLLGAE